MGKTRPSRLGRGLSALMAQPVTPPAAPPAETPIAGAPASGEPAVVAALDIPADQPSGDQLLYLPLASIIPNRHQPRQHFDPEALQRLATSIRREGLIQPIVVRPIEPAQGDVQYELVAGERRWRAAKLAGLEQLPALIRTMDEQQLAGWALIENLQREDLNPIERAEAFRRLIDQFELSHDEVAVRVGVDRSTISNALRLLNLAPAVQTLVRQGTLSAGQARALAAVEDPALQESLAAKAVAEQWSVRQMEKAVRESGKQRGGDAAPRPEPLTPARRATHLADLESRLTRSLETRVQIKPGRKKGSGSLTIEFYSVEQFDGLVQRLGVDLDAGA